MLVSALAMALTHGAVAPPLDTYRDATCSRGSRVFPARWVALQSDRDTFTCLDPRRSREASPREWRAAEFPLDGGRPEQAQAPRSIVAAAAPAPPVAAPAAPPPASATARSYSDDLTQRQRAPSAPAAAATPSSAQAGETPLRPGSSSDRQLVTRAITDDSSFWAWNRLDQGSVSNVMRGPANAAGAYVVQGDYTYNGGSRGWARVMIAGGQVSCIAFHDDPGGCRDVRRPSAGGASSGGSSAGGSRSSWYNGARWRNVESGQGCVEFASETDFTRIENGHRVTVGGYTSNEQRAYRNKCQRAATYSVTLGPNGWLGGGASTTVTIQPGQIHEYACPYRVSTNILGDRVSTFDYCRRAN